jgi:hypothetical protein
MKVVLKSKQYYGTHEDEVSEEFECTVTNTEDVIKVEFEEGYIQIENGKMVHERGENKFIVEEDKDSEVDYDTKRGLIVLDLHGIEVKKYDTSVGLVGSAKYRISVTGIEPYLNEIDIIIKEE